MATNARILTIVALGPALLLACSGDNTGGSDASDGGNSGDVVSSGMDATHSDGTSSTGEGGGNDSTVGSGDADASNPPPGIDAGDGAVVCPTPQYTHVSTFGSIFDGWMVAGNSSASLVPGTGPDGGMIGTLLSLDTTVGSPTPGSAKLVIPFSQPNEQMLFAYLPMNPLNLTGTTVTAQIKLDSGLNTSPVNPGQAFIALKSTSTYIYAAATPIFLDSSASWVTLSFDPGPPAQLGTGYTPCDIREIDVIVQTGMVGMYTTAVVHIDTIAVTAPGVDAGTDDGGPAGDAAPDAADAQPDAAAFDAADAGD